MDLGMRPGKGPKQWSMPPFQGGHRADDPAQHCVHGVRPRVQRVPPARVPELRAGDAARPHRPPMAADGALEGCGTIGAWPQGESHRCWIGYFADPWNWLDIVNQGCFLFVFITRFIFRSYMVPPSVHWRRGPPVSPSPLSFAFRASWTSGMAPAL